QISCSLSINRHHGYSSVLFRARASPAQSSPGGRYIGRGAKPPSEQLGQALFGAGAVELLVGRDAGHDLDDAPLTARLAGLASLQYPHVLERLAVARAPPLLALVMVVLAAGAQRIGHDLGLGGLRQLD